MTHKFIIAALCLSLFASCDLFKEEEQETITIDPNITEEQLQDSRYQFKKEQAYKEKFLHQTKTEQATITIHNVIPYRIQDEGTNIGEGFTYYIFDISIDNFSAQSYPIGDFTKSCSLGNGEPDYAFSNVGFALKMYYLQSDSAETQMPFVEKFYQANMPPHEFYRAKIFAYEVSDDNKTPLIFHFRSGGKTYDFTVKDKSY